MVYMIFDDAWDAVASFDREESAFATLHAIVTVEPDAADHLTIVIYDEEGMPVGDALTIEDVPSPVTVGGSDLVVETLSRVAWHAHAQTRYVPLPVWGARIDQSPPVGLPA